MPETTFACPDLTTFLGLDALGVTAVGQYLTAERAVIECRMPIGFEDPFCKACGAQGQARGTVARRLAHVPVGWRPTQLVVRVRRFACTHCRRVWRQDTSALAQPRARLTHSAVEWGLRALALECMSVSRIAAALGISWHTANNAMVVGLLGVFRTVLVLCFRLPSLSSGARVLLRSGCDNLGLSEGGHDCMSARSTRQYP